MQSLQPDADVNDIPIMDFQNAWIQTLFEKQVEKKSEKTAIRSRDRSVSYGELNINANQLAHYLQKIGLTPPCLVGICLDKSVDMVVAVMAILKAGGTYVPLDPNFSTRRLHQMISDAGLKIIISCEDYRKQLEHCGVPTVYFDSEKAAVSCERIENPDDLMIANRHIYAIFTSGSTGTPKAAAVYHKSFINLIHWFCTTFNIGEDDRVLLISSMGFDLSQKVILAPLVSGGTLCLPSTSTFDPVATLRDIETYAITWINCAPTAFYTLLRLNSAYQKLVGLRHLFLGGEPIIGSVFADWCNSGLCNATIVNTYGPTECTDVCAYYCIRDIQQYQDKPVPIGRPITNAKLLVLNSRMSPVPPGTKGELWIGGACVGSGYINDPLLTADKFIPDLFLGGKGYLYRSGDLARLQPDGNLEFLGRKDHQVKIRGIRIELGEIETLLGRHPQISEVAVTVNKGHTGEKAIVAYFVPTKSGQPTPVALCDFLREDLPEYMLPEIFIELAQMPFTLNGKINRSALPFPEKLTAAKMDTQPPLNDGRFSPTLSQEVLPDRPISPVTTQLINIIAKITDSAPSNIDPDLPVINQIGIDSLSVAQLMVEAENSFGNIDLALPSLLEGLSICDWATRLSRQMPGQNTVSQTKKNNG